MTSADGSPLASIKRGAASVPFTTQTIKGVAYALFDSVSGSYTATYTADTTPPVISGVTASAATNGDATVTWTTDELSSSQVAYGTTASTLNSSQSDPAGRSLPTRSRCTGSRPAALYFYRATSTDGAGNPATAPASPAAPASFTVPTFAATDTTANDFSAGTPGACAVVAHDPGDGEVGLAPAAGAEFSGNAPSVGLGELPVGAGGATVGGGQLTVNGGAPVPLRPTAPDARSSSSPRSRRSRSSTSGSATPSTTRRGPSSAQVATGPPSKRARTAVAPAWTT